MEETNYIHWLGQGNSINEDVVGGKATNLWSLAQAGFPTPTGFCLSSLAYQRFIDEARLHGPLRSALAQVDIKDTSSLDKISAQVQDLISSRDIPNDIAGALRLAYRTLGQMESEAEPFVAVRSSALAEDQAEASFAGFFDSYLNGRGV